MSYDASKKGTAGEPAITRRRMLMRLGLAATAVYAAPVLLQLSEARASGGSGPSRRGSRHSGPSRSGPSRKRSGRHGPSFSDGRQRFRAHASDRVYRPRRIYGGSFSG
ncbi:MAG: hypothetical protein WD207_05775 [Xanthobacteraceae bacterium]